MHRLRTSNLGRGWLAPVAAVLMLGLWLALLGLAASERLHHALHEEAGELHHQCPVVTLASGQLLGAAAFVGVVVASVSLVVRFSPFVSTMRCRLDLALAPGRGPPWVVVPR